jgi:hypothetical protein
MSLSLLRFLPGRPAIVALALVVGPAVAGSAEVDERTLALAGYDLDSTVLYARHPWVLGYYEQAATRPNDRFVLTAGAVSVRLREAGTPDDRVVGDVMVARGFILMRDYAEARRRLEIALADATRLGWSDARANGILRDLAWLASVRGALDDTARYGTRAAVCPEPCEEDFVNAVARSGEAMRAKVTDAPGAGPGFHRFAGAFHDSALRFAEETFGPASLMTRRAMLRRAMAVEEQRPWQAIDHYQSILDFDRARGLAEEQMISLRWTVAKVMLQAGEYARLVPYAAKLAVDAAAEARRVPDDSLNRSAAIGAPRLRARALWHLRDPRARDAYVAAINAMFAFRDIDAARLLLQDLIDARYDAEAAHVADAVLAAVPGDTGGTYAKARVLARAGRFAEAADVVAAIAEPTPVSRLQQAAYLDRAGKEQEAAAIRAAVELPQRGELGSWDGWTAIGEFTDPRDYGAYEGAAAWAGTYLDVADTMIRSATYADAQRLWQIAYTLALGGDTSNSFRLMREAASIAARLSFADANATDGGSLQLLRRDKFRYLLFVDIAWAAVTGAPPDSMSVSSRY